MVLFGLVTANHSELTEEQKKRYAAVYCGICRQIRRRHTNTARLTLSYDMAFLALLLMSLYEPEEAVGDRACLLHPIKPRPWLDNDCVRYAADMNVALSYYKCLDDWQDDHDRKAHIMARHLKRRMKGLEERYPRQCDAIACCIQELSQLEQQGCAEPDRPANCFGALMAQLLVYLEDLWAPYLELLGLALGRFIYLADAVKDYEADKKAGKYNPLPGDDPARWDEYLLLAMARCTRYYERLPLVQDKDILDNILYSGVWVDVGKKTEEQDARRSL